MSVPAVTVAELYRQLALLLQARLPLPESLQQLAEDLNQPAFRAVVQQLGADTLGGQTVSAAMARHPQLFAPVQVRLVALGEQSGALPDVLAVLARNAWDEQRFIRQARDAFLYPAITVYTAGTLQLLLLRYAVPAFGRINMELFGKEPTPLLTTFFLDLGAVVQAVWPALVVLWIAVLVAGAWVFGPSQAGSRALFWWAGLMPLARRVLHEWDHARLCLLLSILIRFQVPMADALELCAEVTVGGGLQRRLRAWALTVRTGTSLAAVPAAARRGCGVLRLAFRPPAEARLADCLAELSVVHQEAAAAASTSFFAVAAVASLALMVVATGLAVLSFFMPFIKLIDSL